jgi:hypothetical protein
MQAPTIPPFHTLVRFHLIWPQHFHGRQTPLEYRTDVEN